MTAPLLEGRHMKRIKLHPNFATVIAKHDLGMNEIADLAGIGRSSLYAIQNPESHDRRVGGMHPKTAWKIVRAFANKTGIAEDDAWGMLIVEVEEPRRQRKKTDITDEAAGEAST